MNLRSVDLNLLVILLQLLEHRQVTRAAEMLNMSQPAVSRALQRLRELFNDPLLVKTGRGYDLSARAEELLPSLQILLSGIEQVISEPNFDPATSNKAVRFYGMDPELTVFLPPLFTWMREQAPYMSMDVRSEPRDHFELLAAGEVHFVISPMSPGTLTDQFHQMPLMEPEFVVVMSADHPLAGRALQMQDYLRASHGLVAITGKGPGLLDQQLAPSGKRTRTILRLSSFASVAHFCESSDVLFMLPKRYAEKIVQGRKLVLRPVPVELDAQTGRFYLYWHERYHHDPMCVWIRRQFKVLHAP